MTNEDSVLKNMSAQKIQHSSSGGIIACVVMMQHVKAVAVALLALQHWFFGKYVGVVQFLLHCIHVIVFVTCVSNAVLEIIYVLGDRRCLEQCYYLCWALWWPSFSSAY